MGPLICRPPFPAAVVCSFLVAVITVVAMMVTVVMMVAVVMVVAVPSCGWERATGRD